jgi:hypothetical protein
MQWETGGASDGINGLGGTSAAAGYSNGLGGASKVFYQAPGSLVNGAFLPGGVNSLSNTSVNFVARNGAITTPPPAAVPEPFTIIGTLIGGTAAFRMKKKLKSTTKI